MLRRRRKNTDLGSDEPPPEPTIADTPVTSSPAEMPNEPELSPLANGYPSPRPSPTLGRRNSTTSPSHSKQRRRFSSTSSYRTLGTSRDRSMSTSYNGEKAKKPESASTLPLLLTFLVPLASFATGGDLLKDAVVLLFLVFYLHQLIKVPWDLYLASRPRQGRRRDSESATTTESHLHVLELLYLSLSVVSPLLGSLFLRSVTSKLGLGLTPDHKPLSWFSTTLFALVAGLRPWNHLIERLRGHTEGLHDIIDEEIKANGIDEEVIEEDNEEEQEDDIEDRFEELQEKLTTLETTNADLNASITVLEKRTWKLERDRARDKKRFEALELTIVGLERTIIAISHQQQHSHTSGYSSSDAAPTIVPVIKRVPNPIFHPIAFTLTMLRVIFSILLAPIAVFFPSLQRHAQHRNTGKSTVHFKLSRVKLPTVLEESESDPDELSEPSSTASANKKVVPNHSNDETEDDDDEGNESDDTVTNKKKSSASDKNFLDIVLWNPSRVIVTFVKGVLRHGL